MPTFTMLLSALFPAAALSAQPDHVRLLLDQEGIRSVIQVEEDQLPFDGGAGSETVLTVDSNPRPIADDICAAIRDSLTLRQGGDEVAYRSTSKAFAPVACRKAKGAIFVDIPDGLGDQELVDTVNAARKVLGKKQADGELATTFESDELRQFVEMASWKDLASVSQARPWQVEFQFALKGLMPRLLGLRFTFAEGRLQKLHINAENSVDVVQP